MSDPLGVLTSTGAVVDQSAHVRIDDVAIYPLTQRLIEEQANPEWDADLHYRATGPDADERTAMWILVLDTLNYCFWGQSTDPGQRWRVRWRGELVDGYVALVAALTMSVDRGYPLHDPSWLAEVSETDVAEILRPEAGHTEIPLFPDRVENLRQLGRALLPYETQPATAFIRAANGSAIALVRKVVREIPSFNDVAIWPYGETELPGNEVRFYKRAQIMVGDLSGGLAGSPLAEFYDLDQLTAFADYKVPQILRALGVLVYDDVLAATIATRQRIPAGSRYELEIRAATIVACDHIADAMRSLGREITSAELDWLLWTRSQHLPAGTAPYHLTATIFY
ncbi:MAG: queuosine salvage family protein [Thermomicrobiales bacterium]|nr:queuosine salvage family protein [Thermomicrobiales bacterium]MCO5218907.1 queuosine salvage family protein [Thermomicrobiales bacterium]MCO5225153.1 queuosine salvage family protein [Thermomicrobiales bacterium]